MEKEKKSRKGTAFVIGFLILIIALLVGYIGYSQRDALVDVPIIGHWLAEDEQSETQVPLEEFIVNGAYSNGRNQMIRLELSLGSVLPDFDTHVSANNARVREDIIYVLTHETPDTLLRTHSDSFVIAENIKTRINETLGDDVIDDVYITDLLIQ